ncbi:MAG TPA: T9SS type A sorting domain-containing protein [Cytophagaceae bacterium]|nr:T9SS type A sorting domain-containing protein [Cytophagaceae bacterium]
MKLFLKHLSLALGVLLTANQSFGSIYIVDNTANTDNLAVYTAADGNNTLRKCIRIANAAAGLDTIRFNLAGVGPYVISVATTALAVTNPLLIDGFSQTGASAGSPVIQLSGAAGIDILQLNSGSNGSTIRGLVIYGANATTGIKITSSSNHIIAGNFIGTNLAGTAVGSSPALQTGLSLSGATGCTIGGTGGAATLNVISGNSQRGIYLQSASNNNIIQGNYIGVTSAGTAALANVGNAIELNASTGCTIGGTGGSATRNIISGNSQRAIMLQASSNNTIIQGNYIGLAATGASAIANVGNAIELNASTGCTIGGAGGGNVISGNSQKGIVVQSASSNAIIQTNIIGLNATGTAALANVNTAIEINASTNCTVGGTAGANTRNIISGNQQRGVHILSSSHNATVQGNYIGVSSSGNVAFGNQQGIEIVSSNNITIGGTLYAARNIISGNTQNGIVVTTCTTLVIKGNFIGLGLDGTTALANAQSGILLQNPTASVTIGGLTAQERNIISSNNSRGVSAANSAGITFQNNYIGTDSTGMLARGNSQSCIDLSNCTTVLIGGTTYNARNILCSSLNGNGISMSNCSTSVVVKGNFIGMAKDGNTVLANKTNGMLIQTSTPITIGGSTLPERNLVSGNLASGIVTNNVGATSIQNNYVGVDSTGMLAKGNAQIGINVSTATSLIVGGIGVGNIVSSNRDGVIISAAPALSFKSNYVGMAVDGTTSLGNTQRGVLIQTSPGSLIGGAVLGERNIISNNAQQALEINNCASSIIYNNYIGVDATGLLNKGNGQNGIVVSTCANIQIGGGSSTTRNICSGNGQDGILINGDCPNAVIKSNFCGVGADGLTVIANAQSGIHFGGGNSDGATIGGSNFMDRNVCSGNGYTTTANSRDGIRIEGGSKSHIIKGNYCGVDSTGMIPLGNVWAGISINEATDCIIGGTGPFEGNISCANQNEGVYFRNALRNTFIGNFVGTDKTGTISMGNEDYGVNIRFTSTDNVIGGSTMSLANIIANTKGIQAGSGQGVYVEQLSQRNKIVRNKIYCNADKGIFLEPSANEGIAAPVLISSDINSVNGTGTTDGDSIHVYLNIKSGGFCDCEGEQFIGGTIVSGGTWTLTHNLGLSTAQTERVTATETTLNNSTSEFSDCIVPLPIQLVSFTAKAQADHSVLVSWVTASEENNYSFNIQRSTDGIHFQTIGTVLAVGNSSQLNQYSYTDFNAPDGILYYRLKQNDIDGTSSFSKVEKVRFTTALSILPTTDGFIILNGGKTNEPITYQVYSLTGVLVAEEKISIASGSYTVHLSLASAMYMVRAYQADESVTGKIVLE